MVHFVHIFPIMIFLYNTGLNSPIQIDLEVNEETIEAKMSVRVAIMEYCKHMAWGLLNYRKKIVW